MLGMNGYQWLVLFAAWLGWGFDIFDGLLFNYVAPNCVPTLLHLEIGTPQAQAATLYWTGLLTSILLIGWALGGILFGKVADRIGRTKTMLLTMAIYSLGTCACAFAWDMWSLVLFRLLVSLGIGGDWAAGASLVAEVAPENRRVEAGALLYTSAPMGLFLATFLNFQIAGNYFKDIPETSWRYVFLCGLIPAALAFSIRYFVKEPERWEHREKKEARLRDLFDHEHFRMTLSGVLAAIVALISWWSCNAFLSVVVSGLARVQAATDGLDKSATLALVEDWKHLATNVFNLGGLIGTLLTVPIAKRFGRKPMLATYFLLSSLSIFITFGVDLPAHIRLYMYFPIGLTVFGVFGCFTYYLPELFPTHLRATGSGFCYNIGRVFASAGPFLVGSIASQGQNTLTAALTALSWIALVPLIGVLGMPWIVETKDRKLVD
ncbi:MAG: MFS transporter [Candidatus Latescibacteria bacterium]|nr:MFS transporter [Candidatus Latescibacterota bacterium]